MIPDCSSIAPKVPFQIEINQIVELDKIDKVITQIQFWVNHLEFKNAFDCLELLNKGAGSLQIVKERDVLFIKMFFTCETERSIVQQALAKHGKCDEWHLTSDQNLYVLSLSPLQTSVLLGRDPSHFFMTQQILKGMQRLCSLTKLFDEVIIQLFTHLTLSLVMYHRY